MYIFNILLSVLLLKTVIGSPSTESVTNPKVVCYYGSWSVYRNGIGKFDVENIDPNLCTHIIYTFAGLDESTSTIKVLDPWNDLPDNWGKNAYGRITGLKAQNPKLKILLAIGGWNEGSKKYSKMAADSKKRAVFIKSSLELLLKYNFDGLDMDWEYPALRGGVPEDKDNFSILLKELKKAFTNYGLLLTAAVGVGPATIASAYDVPAISESLDFINLMTYDFHGSWEKKTGHHTPLSVRPSETGEWRLFNLESSVSTWLKLGAPAHKLILGLATYGRTFTLADVTSTGLDAPTTGPGKAGRYTQQQGMLGYYEICSTTGDWEKFYDNNVAAPWVVKGNQWIGFDDAESIITKSKWGVSLGLGGAMIWSFESDDFRNICGQGRFPLLSAINQVWRHGTPDSSTTTPIPHNTQSSSSNTYIRTSSTQNGNHSTLPATKITINPTSKPVTSPTINPTSKPVTRTTINPTSKPVTRTTINPTSKPVTRTTINPTSKPVTRTTINPTSKPVTSTSNPTSKLVTSTSNPTSKPVTSTTEHLEVSTIPNNNACSQEGYFSISQDCSKFYFCGKFKNAWIKFNFHCPAGLYFNSEIVACDWQYNVPQCQ